MEHPYHKPTSKDDIFTGELAPEAMLEEEVLNQFQMLQLIS